MAELYLYGNWISAVESDAFKPLKRLRILDLSTNYLEQIPLEAFKPLETQIRSIRTEGESFCSHAVYYKLINYVTDNPLFCTCDSEELWEWYKDHRRQLEHPQDKHLKCEHPEELRGKVLVELDPEQFCKQPLVIKLGIQDIQPFSVVVSWQSRNHSGLHGYQIAYYSIETVEEVSCVHLFSYY